MQYSFNVDCFTESSTSELEVSPQLLFFRMILDQHPLRNALSLSVLLLESLKVNSAVACLGNWLEGVAPLVMVPSLVRFALW